MDNFTDKQYEVFRFARVELQKQPWYKGVETSGFPDDNECRTRFFDSVEKVFQKTRQRDDPFLHQD